MIDILTLICVILLVLDNADARKRAETWGRKIGRLVKRI